MQSLIESLKMTVSYLIVVVAGCISVSAVRMRRRVVSLMRIAGRSSHGSQIRTRALVRLIVLLVGFHGNFFDTETNCGKLGWTKIIENYYKMWDL